MRDAVPHCLSVFPAVHPAAGGHQSSREQAVVQQVQVGHTCFLPERTVCDETSSERGPAGQTSAGC